MTSLEEAAAHWREWFDRGELADGARRVQEALEAPGGGRPCIERVRVLYAAHLFAFRLGESSREFARASLELARQLGDTRGECDGLTGLARAALRDGDYALVAELAAEGLGKARSVGDRSAEAAPLHLYAAGVRLSGDYDLACDLYLESIELARELEDERREQMELHNLGWVELHRGSIDAAARLFAERNALSGKDAYSDAWEDLNAAAVAVVRGNREQALDLFESGRATIDALGAALDPDDRFEFDWLGTQLAPSGRQSDGRRT